MLESVVKWHNWWWLISHNEDVGELEDQFLHACGCFRVWFLMCRPYCTLDSWKLRLRVIGRLLALSASCIFAALCLSSSNLRLTVLRDEHPLFQLEVFCGHDWHGWFLQAVCSVFLCNTFLEHHNHTFFLGATVQIPNQTSPSVLYSGLQPTLLLIKYRDEQLSSFPVLQGWVGRIGWELVGCTHVGKEGKGKLFFKPSNDSKAFRKSAEVFFLYSSAWFYQRGRDWKMFLFDSELWFLWKLLHQGVADTEDTCVRNTMTKCLYRGFK